jgi:hypothetical protein
VKDGPLPRVDATGSSEKATVHDDQPPPPYSKDPEKGETITDNQKPASNHEIEHISDQEIRAPVYTAYEMPLRDAMEIESGSTLTTAQTVVTNSSIQTQTQTGTEARVQSQIDKDEGAALYYLISNFPGAVLVFTGLVGQLAHNLPAGWADKGPIPPTIIAFSLLMVATVLFTLFWLLRIRAKKLPSDTESVAKKRSKYINCLLLCAVVLSFFVVSFDQWILAALGEDGTGTKHILSDGGLPLAYMIVTKLPALAL